MSDPQPYDAMSPSELADLEREAGRSLTVLEALAYLKRRTHNAAVDDMLRQPCGACAGKGKVGEMYQICHVCNGTGMGK